VSSWAHVPDVQPAIVLDEFFECEAAVRADPGWQAAMRRRGVPDFSLAMVDPWSAGRRLSRTLTWVRRSPTDNGYARPVANLIATVDLDEMKVIAIEDYGVVPLPPEDEAPGAFQRRSKARTSTPSSPGAYPSVAVSRA
jgi:primary-amine oxidase